MEKMRNGIVRRRVSRRAMTSRTPVNVITGVLGAGKTTLVREMVAKKPSEELWVVIVNDFGALGIDGALVDDVSGRVVDGAGAPRVVVREVSGGCACCASSSPFEIAVAQTIRRFRPSRVLVEPSGLGDAGKIIDALRSKNLRESVEVRATVCVVDVREFGARATGVRASELFRAQTECAEALCGTHQDVADDGDVERFREFGEGFWPKKNDIFLARERDWAVDLATLDAACGWESRAPATEDEASPSAGAGASRGRGPFELVPRLVANGTPWMVKNESDDHYASCGYAFHADDVFVRPLLRKFFDEFLLQRADVVRFKGVLRLGAEWARPDVDKTDPARGKKIAFTESSYRRDSRIEVIRRRSPDVSRADDDDFWNEIRGRLVACRKPPRS